MLIARLVAEKKHPAHKKIRLHIFDDVGVQQLNSIFLFIFYKMDWIGN